VCLVVYCVVLAVCWCGLCVVVGLYCRDGVSCNDLCSLLSFRCLLSGVLLVFL